MLHQDDLDDFAPGIITEKGDDPFGRKTGDAAEPLVCLAGKAGGKGPDAGDGLFFHICQPDIVEETVQEFLREAREDHGSVEDAQRVKVHILEGCAAYEPGVDVHIGQDHYVFVFAEIVRVVQVVLWNREFHSPESHLHAAVRKNSDRFVESPQRAFPVFRIFLRQLHKALIVPVSAVRSENEFGEAVFCIRGDYAVQFGEGNADPAVRVYPGIVGLAESFALTVVDRGTVRVDGESAAGLPLPGAEQLRRSFFRLRRRRLSGRCFCCGRCRHGSGGL